MLGLRKFIRLIFSLIPDALQLTRGIPRQILLISFKGNTDKEIFKKIQQLHAELDTEKKQYGISGFEVLATDEDAQKFWIMRRYSFKSQEEGKLALLQSRLDDGLISEKQYNAEVKNLEEELQRFIENKSW